MASTPVLEQIGSVFLVTLDESLYSREAVLRTCYWFTNRCYLFVRRPQPGLLEVQLKSKAATLQDPAPQAIQDTVGEFLNALLDHQLRQDIEEKTAGVRHLLIAKAFAEAGIMEDAPPGTPNDPVDTRYFESNGSSAQ